MKKMPSPGRINAMLIASAALLVCCVSAHAQAVTLSGQASGWVTAKRDDLQIGLRYIPNVSLVKNISEDYDVSAEAAVNAQGYTQYDRAASQDSATTIAPYRLWVRFASAHAEARAGLQKISFGSATLLRPLMWFDSIDPRDPLQMTNGVYGLLGRYNFSNNANIWMWALYGNNDLRGWETLLTDKRDIERGGRIQTPVKAGEMGFSYHRRTVNPEGSAFGVLYPTQAAFQEDRFGLDGKWDIGAGVWFEGTAVRRGLDAQESRYLRFLTVGADYTFDLSNGPHLLVEQFVRDEAKRVFSSGTGAWLSVLSIDYPFSMLDKATAIAYYDWKSSEWSRVLQWRRTYDRWQMHVSAFWNPDRINAAQDTAAFKNYSGKGVQLMLVFDH